MAKRPKCPICGRPVGAAHRPFCSRCCAEEDLARWLTGRYVIPANPENDDEGLEAAEDEETDQKT